MSIRKGLIIYRAERHQNVYPVNLKHRSSSNKLSLPPEVPKTNRDRTIQQRAQIKITKIAKISKMTRCFNLSFVMDNLKKSQIIRYFSKLHRVKKLSIHLKNETELSEISEDVAIGILKRGFRTLKNLEEVSLNNLDSLQKDFKSFKNLLLQRCLKKLTVSPLKFSEDVNSLAPFLKLSQVAEKRKSWPHMKELIVNFEYSEEEHVVRNRGANRNHPGGFENLLKFLQDFKSCKSFEKCSHFQLNLPEEADSDLSKTEAAAFDGVLKLKPPFTSISTSHGEIIESLFAKAQHCKELRSIDLSLSNNLSDYLKMDPLKKFPALQEMSLLVNCEHEFDDESPEAHFSYFALEKMGSLTNLRSVSLYFDGDPGGVDDLLRTALSKLTELTHLTLRFPNMISFEERFEEEDYDDDYYDDDEYDEDEEDEENEGGERERGGPRKLNWSWLKEVFQSIGKMKKLKELSLDFETFNFHDSSGIFKGLCQALGRLAHLSSFTLLIGDGELMKDQDISVLASYMNKLTKMESLVVNIGNSTVQHKTFVQLMDSIIKNLRVLSDLDLKIRCADVTKQCHQIVYQAIWQMKCLNKMNLEIKGKLGKGVNLTPLDAEVRKRMAGNVSNSF